MALACAFLTADAGGALADSHAIAMHGAPLYQRGFSHFPYVRPDAPKGGTLNLSRSGTFDSVNPFIIRGKPAAGLREFVYESLMARGWDEPFTLYGLLAETIETPPDRSSVLFTLHPKARFSDGSPVRAEDVLFSARTLREKGRPNHRFYYGKIARMEKVGARGVRFIFKAGSDREMPLIMGLMPILSRAYFTKHRFDETSLKTPIGSGAYRVAEIAPGEKILYQRDLDYWGKDLPVNRGRFNADRVLYRYFRDEGSAFEAFKAGEIDARAERDVSRWAAQYDAPARDRGRILLKEIPTGSPSGMWGLVFNTRRGIFSDRRVREALSLLLDAEWINAHLFHGKYRRIGSFFANSDLSSHGLRASAGERALLASFSDEVAPEILERGYRPPVSEGRHNRAGRRAALALFGEAGWFLEGGVLRDVGGEVFRFEILCVRRHEERLALVFARQLRLAGVEARVRFVDSAQGERRMRDFDFDMIFYRWGVSLSPGNEQAFYWGSEAAGFEGSRNYAGVRSGAVDFLIGALVGAEDRGGFRDAVRALDRVLLSGFYVIPLFYSGDQWLAVWDWVGFPERGSLYGTAADLWWLEGGSR